MNRYDPSSEYYRQDHREGRRRGGQDFAAIAYYNLSLLEHNFYHYNSALSYTDESLAMEDRPSGHLARGELFQSRMDFGAAQTEYEAPCRGGHHAALAVNLAILYQAFGRLELARATRRRCWQRRTSPG